MGSTAVMVGSVLVDLTVVLIWSHTRLSLSSVRGGTGGLKLLSARTTTT